MKKYFYLGIIVLFISTCTNSDTETSVQKVNDEMDYSAIRGFNYTPAAARGHASSWLNYDESVTEFDLDLAVSLNLNQTRVFVPLRVYTESEDKELIKARLQHFVRACDGRGIGVMMVVGGIGVLPLGGRGGGPVTNEQLDEWAAFLVDALADEPGLAFWDVGNEPDNPGFNREQILDNYEICKYLSEKFHELDPNTPVTLGMTFPEGMIEMADYVDVLQFHDYLQTKGEIRDSIAKAKSFAASAGKPLINGEIGCVARANPYDITLKEHMDANVGWYFWELMIVREGWGSVHGIFYEDGTVRDPSIIAALMGHFRKREGDILPAVPDNEGWVTRVVNGGNEWIAQADPDWEHGLKLAETAAHLMESAELVAMRIPPTWEVNQLREGETDIPALKELLGKYIEVLEPYFIERRGRN